MIIIVTTIVTGIFQVVLNRAFRPLLKILSHAENCESLKFESLNKDV